MEEGQRRWVCVSWIMDNRLDDFERQIYSIRQSRIGRAYNRVGEIKTEAEEPKEYKLDATKAKTDLGDVATKATDIKTKVETPKTLSVDTATANTNLTGIQNLLTTITTTAWNAALTIVTTGAEAVTAAKDTLVEIAKEWASSLTITVTGLADLVSALAYHRALDGLRTDSYHTVHVNYEGEGSTVKPLGEKVKEVKGWLESTKKLAEKGAKFTIEFMGKGSTAKPLGEKIAEIKEWKKDNAKDNAKEYEKGGAVQQLDSGGKIPGFGGGDTVPAMLEKGEYVVRKEAVGKYGKGFFDLLNGMVAKFAKGGPVNLSGSVTHSQPWSNDWERIIRDYGLQAFKEWALRVRPAAKWNQILGTAFNAKMRKYIPQDAVDMAKAVMGYEPYGTKMLSMNRAENLMQNAITLARFASGGLIPGFGGGDTVPAMLKKGEYVIREEAVQKYGTGLMNSINSGMAKFMAGGIVKPQIVFDQPMQRFASGGSVQTGYQSGSQFTGKLHTISLNVNNTPHTLYGDEQAVNGLVKSLRRAQLMTA